MRTRILRWAPFAAVLAIVVLYLVYLQQYAVNVPYWDEWAQVPIIGAALHGHLSLGALWAQHNENRMLFPNLIAVALGFLAHWDLKVEMWLGALFLIGSYVALAHAGGWFRRGWLLVPPTLVWFSLAQHENTLSGFQEAWYLVLLCLVLSLVLLDRPGGGIVARACAYAAAVIGSFSSLQGLLIWPCGLLILLVRRRPRRESLCWIGAAIATAVVYLAHFNFNQIGGSALSFFLHHPIAVMQYFLAALGSVVRPTPAGLQAMRYTQVIGLGILALCVYSIIAWLQAWKAGEDRSHLSAALVVFGLLFDSMLTLGRSSFGLPEAASSRYTTYNLVLLVGLYWLLVDAVSSNQRAHRTSLYAIGALSVLLLLQVPLSVVLGIHAGRSTQQQRTMAEDVLANYGNASDAMLQAYLFPSAPLLRQWAALAEREHLSLFASPQLEVYTHAGIVPGGRPAKLLPLPSSLRAALNGKRGTQAWSVLSTVYAVRPQLQRAFPEDSPSFPSSLVGWACTTGLATQGVRVFLAPYRDEYQAMCVVRDR